MKSLSTSSGRLSIALREIKAARGLDRWVVIIVTLMLILTAVAVYTSFILPGDEKVYRVTTDDPKLAGILQSSPRIALSGKGDVRIVKGQVLLQRDARSQAAFKAVIDEVNRHNRLLADAAYRRGEITYEDVFPIWVKLQDISRLEILNDTGTLETEDRRSIGLQERSYRGAGSVQGAIESALVQTKYDEIATPDELDRILPVKSILISLLLLTPIIFITTAYNNSFFSEKIEKKATMLFMAPVGRGSVILFKSLPYVAAGLVASTLVLAYFDFSSNLFKMLLPMASIVLLYFSLNFLLTVLSRSYKEISFLKTSMGSVFIAYMLLPTLFMEMSDIAYISPLTTIVKIVEGAEITTQQYFFSFLPMLAAGAVIYYFASLLFTEEHYYSEKPILRKLLDMVAAFTKKPYSVGLLTLLAFPVVIVIELVFLMMAALPTSEVSFLFMLLIVVAAVTEELFKNIGIYLIYTRSLFEAPAWKLAAYSGFAFALAEKSLLLFMMPVLLEQYAKVVIPSLIVPFIFHSLTCLAFAAAVRKTRHPISFAVPVLIHLAYGMIVFGVFA